MRIAIAQMTTTSNADGNLDKMRGLLAQAKTENARLVVFPEMASFRGNRAQCLAERDRYEQRLALFGEWAREFGLYLVPGSLREPAPGDRWYNTVPVFGADGTLLASYQKIFLFRANLPGESYDEPRYCEPGERTVVVPVDDWKIGLSVCFDLRFPELYRRLLHQGAEAFLAPASFTLPTGKAHWDLLTRSRAVENAVPLAAPGQIGVGGDGLAAYGHSRLVSPWGDVEAELTTKEGIVTLDWSKEATTRMRSRLDVWSSRRGDLFPPHPGFDGSPGSQ